MYIENSVNLPEKLIRAITQTVEYSASFVEVCKVLEDAEWYLSIYSNQYF